MHPLINKLIETHPKILAWALDYDEDATTQQIVETLRKWNSGISAIYADITDQGVTYLPRKPEDHDLELASSASTLTDSLFHKIVVPSFITHHTRSEILDVLEAIGRNDMFSFDRSHKIDGWEIVEKWQELRPNEPLDEHLVRRDLGFFLVPNEFPDVVEEDIEHE